MIEINRSSDIPIHRQIADQIRFQIARGRYVSGSSLPSTRALAGQIGVSFHSVRRAYQELATDGVVSASAGRGYTVVALSGETTSDQMENGAAIIEESLTKLVGLGLSESDIEYLFEEQLALMSASQSSPKVIFVGRYLEEARQCSLDVSNTLQRDVEPVVGSALGFHDDADYVITPYSRLRETMQQLPRADVVGVTITLSADALAQAARLTTPHTIVLLTLLPDAIGPMSAELRQQTGFSGQVLAASVKDGSGGVAQLVDQADLILFTPGAKRRVSKFVGDDAKSFPVYPVLAPSAIGKIVSAIPETSNRT